MMAEVVTKRLHVSGLTPSITPTDILHRLSTFGPVKSLDGLGKLDALGNTRHLYMSRCRARKRISLNVRERLVWRSHSP
ncbi:hypothetical protein BKA83DRAFT_4225758 [Pisolithus microcarpus]|nr:hypothetical protein BKA83DRAFT_4225758 [Pisolithus microcarpus]